MGGGFRGGVGDTVSPSPQGTSVFVVVTKQILTENQEQGVCPEVWGHGVAWGAPVCPNPHTPPLCRVKPHTGVRPTVTVRGRLAPRAVVSFGGGEVPKTTGFEPTHLMATGVLTGRCVPYNVTLHTCEIRGWCPPEVDTVDV